jgi:hypothetical protein
MLLCVSVVDSLAWAYLVTNVLLTNHAAEVSTTLQSMTPTRNLAGGQGAAKASRMQNSKALTCFNVAYLNLLSSHI